jgi:hypothetical protein
MNQLQRSTKIVGAGRPLPSGVSKSRQKLTWKTAEKITDGYRILYSEKSQSGTDYTTVYLRTIRRVSLSVTARSTMKPFDVGRNRVRSRDGIPLPMARHARTRPR